MLGEQEAYKWLEWVKTVRGASDRTLERYAQLLIHYLKWCEERQLHPLEIREEELEPFTSRRTRGGGTRTAATKQVERSILKNWYDWLARRRITDIADPTLSLPQPTLRNVNPQPVHLNDWLALWLTDLTPRWRFGLGASYYLGLRASENVGIYTHQLKDKSIWNLRGKGEKVVHYPWRLVTEILAQFKPELRVDLFVQAYEHCQHIPNPRPSPWTSRGHFYKSVQGKALKAGIAQGAITSRRMRSSAATNLLEAGLPKEHVQSLTRHSQMSTVERYAKNTGSNIRRWFEREMRFYDA